ADARRVEVAVRVGRARRQRTAVLAAREGAAVAAEPLLGRHLAVAGRVGLVGDDDVAGAVGCPREAALAEEEPRGPIEESLLPNQGGALLLLRVVIGVENPAAGRP